MNLKSFRLLFACTLLIGLGVTGCKNKTAEVLYVNGVIHTMNPDMEVAQAMAIQDGKIIATGKTNDLSFEYAADTIIDLRGKAIFPGFIDAHCHYYGYAMNLKKVNLVGTTSWDEVVALVDTFAQQHPDGWIQGRGWDQNDWSDRSYPTKELLDEKYPDRPVLLRRVDGHAAIANQAALDAANVTSKSTVQGGRFVKDRRGRLTGVIIDKAVDVVEESIPPASHAEITQQLKEAEANLFSVGLTTVDDAGLDLEIIQLIDSLQQAGELKIRVYAMANPTEENFDHFLGKPPYKTERMHVRGFKIYADGALGSRGACLIDPYKDQPREQGFLLEDVGYYEEVAQRIHDGGFQMNTHCIGDSANRLMLKVYGQTLGEDNDERWRIEHAQVIHPDDFELFDRYNIIPSVQPSHATSDMYWAEDRIGKERLEGAYAYKSLLAAHGFLAFGSDFPVESINPILGFYAAVARKDLTNFPYGGFMMDQAVGRDTAIQAMTIWAAKANFEEKIKGSLEPGKVADFVILEDDIMFMEEDQVPYVQVLETVLDGETVFQAE